MESQTKDYPKTKTLLRPCPICGSGKGEALHTQKFLLPQGYLLPAEYDVVACAKCGFVYADTGASQQDYDTYYQSLSIYEDEKAGHCNGTSEHDRKRLADIAEEIMRTCPNKTAKIIEIGCANGDILKTLKDKGYTDLTGVELSEKCIEHVVSCGITGVQGAISEAGCLLGEKFDCVILSHVMEHVYDLKEALRQCRDLMREGALLYLEVPDAARYSEFYIDPYHHFNIEHINHFDEISLSNLGATANFSKRRVGYKTTPLSSTHVYPAIFIIFEKVKAMDNAAIDVSTKARQSVEAYLELSAQGSYPEIIAELLKTQEELYVFGVGNLTFRLLATTDLPKCNIKAFIDNDPKKVINNDLTQMGSGKMLINRRLCTPDVLAGATGTVAICSVRFAQEIEAQVKLINKNLKIVMMK
jgi:SAM-dependent methyltransferase